MESQNIPRYDSLEEALEFTFRLTGKSYKEVAHNLWPSLNPEQSYRRLTESLNPSKNQKFSIDEIIHICNFCGRFDALYYMADECGHSRPKMKTSLEEEHEIKEMFLDMQATINKSFELFQLMIKKKEHRESIREEGVYFLNKKFAQLNK